MEIILRDDPGPSDDQVVVIHMGAGAVDVAVAAALRNYRAYQAFSARGGEFTVSVFAAMAGITEDMILGAMPHPQYGRARYGAVRSHFSLLPTTILGTPVPDDVMAVHYDVILPTGALQLPDEFDPTGADDDLVDRVRSALNAPMAELLRLSSHGSAGKIEVNHEASPRRLQPDWSRTEVRPDAAPPRA